MSEHESEIPSFLHTFPGAVLRLDPDGLIRESNGRLERVLGRELRGEAFAELLDPASSRGKWLRVVRRAEATEAIRCELILKLGESLSEPIAFFVMPDGAERGVWLLEVPADPRLERLTDEVHTINSALNTTQRELSKEKRRLDAVLRELQDRQADLARSNRDLQQFAHVISHDLKAPLRSVRSYAEFLRQDLAGTLPQEADGFLERIIIRAADMDAMIDGVLRYARAGQASAPEEEVDVGALVRQLVDLHDVDQGIRVVIDPGLPVVKADPTQLRQVLQNLISNGLRYGRGEDPTLEISSTEAGDFHEIRIADNGPGIAEKDQERIWNLFYTTSARTETADAGSGIGLALVKRLVERNGGVVTLQSSEGGGAAFTVRWPKKAPVGG